MRIKGLFRATFLTIFSLVFLGANSVFASDEKEEYDLVESAMHHISDANEFHIIGDIHLPLPCILYAPGQGWTFCLSSKFDHGHRAVDGYVMYHGRVKRVKKGLDFPRDGEVEVGEFFHLNVPLKEVDELEVLDAIPEHTDDGGIEADMEEVEFVEYEGKYYPTEHASTADGGIFGGRITSYYDFSITKNVFTMILAFLFLLWLFVTVANGYKKRKGMAPKGIQSFMEPFFVFMRDEVCIPMIGEKHYERFQPFIMSLFFFILTLNLLGLVPFFPGSSNVTGNLAVTMTLAIFTFVVTNIHGNRHYWEHIFWMPGIPAFVKFILTPVEFLGLFIKSFTLMIRLFANITAGHIVILSLIGLIFVFGDNGSNIGGAIGGGFLGILFTAFMNLIEVIVAFIQAFIFAILSASYIGAAIKEPAHH